MDLLNKPEVFALLNHLLSLVQPKLHNIFYNKGQQRRPNNRPPMGGPQGQPGQAPRPMMGQQPRVGGPPMPMGGQPNPMMQQRPPMGMPGPMGMPPQMMG